MDYKVKLQTNNNKLEGNNLDLQTILTTINNLPTAGSSGGGMTIETATVSIHDQDGTIGCVCASVYKDGQIYSEKYPQSESYEYDITIENVIKNSHITVISGNDYTDSISGATEISYEETSDFVGYFKATYKIDDSSASISLGFSGVLRPL